MARLPPILSASGPFKKTATAVDEHARGDDLAVVGVGPAELLADATCEIALKL